nr:hypothetical protein [uncultured Butyrivibrio sp.]
MIVITPLKDGEGYIYGYDEPSSSDFDPVYEFYYGECKNGTFNGIITGQYQTLSSHGYVAGNITNGLRNGKWHENEESKYRGNNKITCTFTKGQSNFTQSQQGDKTSYACGKVLDETGKNKGAYLQLNESDYNMYYADRYWGVGKDDFVNEWNFRYDLGKTEKKIRLGY